MNKVKFFESSSGKVSEPKTEQNYKETSWLNLQCSNSSQVPSQNNIDDSHRFLSLYKIRKSNHATALTIYDIEKKQEEVKIVDYKKILNEYTSITQLPNGELFCYGGWYYGITMIIDRSYGVRILPHGIPCDHTSALYFDSHVYCFGIYNEHAPFTISSKFDLKQNRWINLTSLPETDCPWHSAIFNGNILISGFPNGELFCYGGWSYGITMIIDRNYGVRRLPNGISCFHSSALYFENNVYCFGIYDEYAELAVSSKFDLKKNKWINLPSLPEIDCPYHSVIFNGNILISGLMHINLWLYSIEINSFSIIPYAFKAEARKLLVNVERLYLIEWGYNGLIYESEDEYDWKPISKSGQVENGYLQMYCLYNKGKIYISSEYHYYQFDLKKKVLLEIQ